MNIREHINDLLVPFRKGYHNLNPLVQNGGHAMTIFPTIKDMSDDEAAEARQALLDYCHLDTLAMVRVWEKLEGMVK